MIDITRRYDIFLGAMGESPRVMGFDGSSAMAIAGSMKASQLFIKAFLSSAGERREQEVYGTQFGQEMGSGSMAYPMQVKQAFYFSSTDAIDYLKSNYSDNTPDDERVLSVELIDYSIPEKGSINLSVELTTKSLKKNSFLLPVHF